MFFTELWAGVLTKPATKIIAILCFYKFAPSQVLSVVRADISISNFFSDISSDNRSDIRNKTETKHQRKVIMLPPSIVHEAFYNLKKKWFVVD